MSFSARAACTASCLLAALSLPSSLARAQEDALPNLWVTDFVVDGLAVKGDTLFVGGDFSYVGPPTGQLAVLDKATGEANVTLPRIGGYLAQVLAVLPDGAGGYYVSGDFEYASGEPRRNLARVLPDGTLDPDFRPNPRTTFSPYYFGSVDALALDPQAPSPSGQGVLYVGGEFDTVGGQRRDALAALDAVTGVPMPFDANLGGGSNPLEVTELVARAGVLYVGGDFATVDGQPRPNAVALDGATGALLPWGVEPNATATPVALADSTLYLAGSFMTVNGQSRQALAEVTLYDAATGGGDVTAWAPQQAVYGLDFALSNGDLWAVQFNPPLLKRVNRMTGGVSSVSVAPALHSSRAVAFDPVGGSSGQGTLYLACSRDYSTGTIPAPVVLAVDPVTGQPTGFEVRGGGGPSGQEDARTLAVEPGPEGRLFVGGASYSFGGARRGGTVALDLTTGRLIEGFDGQGFPAADLALSPDGRYLYAFNGQFGFTLREFDLVTGAVRDLPTSNPAPPPTPRPPGPTRVFQGSALAVTEDRIYATSGGMAAYDRESGAEVWALSASAYFSRNNGDIVLLDGPDGPGGDDGTLYVAGPFFELGGVPLDGFAAVAPRTGDVLAWDAEVGAFSGSAEGYAAAWLDVDGDGPADPALYLGGDRIGAVQGEERESAFAVDPTTATLLPWAPEIGLSLVTGLATHRRGDGPGGVAYGPFSDAYDAETAERLDWNPALVGSAQVLLISGQHGAVFLGGAFYNSLQGSGHANVVAVTPAASILLTSAEPAGPGGLPDAATLTLAGPNPFASSTALALTLPEAQRVEATLYDVLGRRVAVLHKGPLAAGTHRLEVSGAALPAGVYVGRVAGEAFTASRSLTLVR